MIYGHLLCAALQFFEGLYKIIVEYYMEQKWLVLPFMSFAIQLLVYMYVFFATFEFLTYEKRGDNLRSGNDQLQIDGFKTFDEIEFIMYISIVIYGSQVINLLTNNMLWQVEGFYLKMDEKMIEVMQLTRPLDVDTLELM